MGARIGAVGRRGAVLPAGAWGWLGWTAGLAALVVAALGVLYGGESGPGEVDERIGPVVDGVGSPWREAALAVDALGEPVGAALLVGALVAGLLVLRHPRAAAFLVVGVGAAVGTATLLKHVVGRTIHGGDNLSYPSGHTAFLTALALVLAVVTAGPGRGRSAGTLLVPAAAVAAGGVMGWAQVALGAHYPTDALGGWCTALAVTPAAGWLVDRAAGRRRRS
ncbi:phosphatase PAP2 family protein [Kitasatospora sp. NPDC056327]|uniref:phosphatase PAP2 family protein n=1 Tax=Kitasatospora sp. NPDC056327 TaxID=3345785 RepID=UPI0035DD35A6